MKQSKKTLLLLIGILTVMTCVTYINHFDNSFQFDDFHCIVNNTYIRNINNIPLMFTSIKTSGSMQTNLGYRPMVTATAAIDYWMGGGLKPFWFHFSMFIEFIIQGILMVFIFLKIFNTCYKHKWNKYIALFAGAWYLLSPGNAETINYISARSDSLSVFFIVIMFAMYIFSKVCRKYHLYLVPIFFAIASKESAVVAPVLLLLYIAFFENDVSIPEIFKKDKYKLFLNALLKSLPAFLFMLIVTIFTIVLSAKQSPYWGASPSNNTILYFFQYVITQPFVLFLYSIQMIVPVGLSTDPEMQLVSKFTDIRIWVGLIFLITLIIVAVKSSMYKKYRPIAFGLLWFLIASVPTSFLTPLSQVANSHRLFFPYIGLALSISWTVYLFIVKIMPVFNEKLFIKYIVVISFTILCAYSWGTYERNKVWENESSLWYDVLQKNPENPRALMNYGLYKMAKGEFNEAEFYFNKTIKIWPNWIFIHINMAIVKESLGNIPEAEKYYHSAIALSRGLYPDPYFYYARYLFHQAKYDESIFNANQALKINKLDMKAHHLLMELYLKTRNIDKLKQEAQFTLQIDPNDEISKKHLAAIERNNYSSIDSNNDYTVSNNPDELINFSLLYYNSGDYEKCIRACEKAITLKPNYAIPYNNICVAYKALKKYDKAIKACEKAISIDPTFTLARNNLKDIKATQAKENK